MKTSSDTEQRIADMMERMRKALPEVRRQIKIYEESIRSGKKAKLPKITLHARNV